jgi:hypothetical protein
MNEKNAYDEIFNYICDGSYPSGAEKDQKRNLRKKAEKFVLKDGALFYVGKSNSQPRRWVYGVEEQKQILTACHADKLAGHFGRDKTRDKVCIQYILNSSLIDNVVV